MTVSTRLAPALRGLLGALGLTLTAVLAIAFVAVGGQGSAAATTPASDGATVTDTSSPSMPITLPTLTLPPPTTPTLPVPTTMPVMPQNPSNPLAGRVWGVYKNTQEPSWVAWLSASLGQRTLLNKIVDQPKALWFTGRYDQPGRSIARLIRDTELGNPDAITMITLFRMVPWEQTACQRLPTAAEQASYRWWINDVASAIGTHRVAFVLQPDMPFLRCIPHHSRIPAQLLRWTTQRLGQLPNSSVYIEAGAADWLRGNVRAAVKMLRATGVKTARGFAFNGTHYDSTAHQIDFGARIAHRLAALGMPGKHFIVNTAENGRPFEGYTYKGPDFDNANVCKTRASTRCVTLGIPPTTDVANPRWGLTATQRAKALKYCDGYVWFGRPWLHRQAWPFDLARALQLAATTPYQ